MVQYDRFGEIIDTVEEEIRGISKSEMASFIENNQEHYIGIFEKNENRKFFLHMNWAAMFLSIYWMFYRKMFMTGALYLLCSAIFSTLIFSISLVSLKDDISTIREQQNKATFYQSEYTTDEFADLSGYFADNQTKLNQMKNDLYSKLFSFIILPFIVFALVFGLIADCLYRNHILKKIEFSDGGTSNIIGLLFFGWHEFIGYLGFGPLRQ
ncbi:MAG: DUF2628 domain-containing protein [Oscillospiraceae bacterium]|nr:DUF2628 domain-containing protein [Oscillospiraceae bacterium]MDD4414177.1 DUF2628 domain-containing protein [Oscillospiraceae bacterium]